MTGQLVHDPAIDRGAVRQRNILSCHTVEVNLLHAVGHLPHPGFGAPEQCVQRQQIVDRRVVAGVIHRRQPILIPPIEIRRGPGGRFEDDTVIHRHVDAQQGDFAESPQVLPEERVPNGMKEVTKPRIAKNLDVWKLDIQVKVKVRIQQKPFVGAKIHRVEKRVGVILHRTVVRPDWPSVAGEPEAGKGFVEDIRRSREFLPPRFYQFRNPFFRAPESRVGG